jgi:hypothetical protein
VAGVASSIATLPSLPTLPCAQHAVTEIIVPDHGIR